MASSWLGPIMCSAQPAQGASSTYLPSNRCSFTSGSRAAVAVPSDWATLLPEPGSPP
jgi:hypothetical protein